jgi:Transposase DDE domain
MPSLSIADTTFGNIVQELPAGVAEMAREFRAFARGRAVKSPEELLRAVLLYCGLDYTLREVAANFTQIGWRLSDEAVRKRLSACEPWLAAMLQQMLPLPEVGIGRCGVRLLVVDGTTVQAPGATSSDYRIHLAWNWMEQRVASLKITDSRTGESLELYEWLSGDVILADSCYARAPQLKLVTEKGAKFVVRCPPTSVRMLLETGKKLNIADELRKCEGERVVTIPVTVNSLDVNVTAYLHAYRLSDSTVEKARRKMKQKASKRCRPAPTADTLYLAGWMLLLTSFDPKEMLAEKVGKLYTARWQIEIVIKRLKSVLNIDALRARRGSRLAEVYLLGKSFYAVMIETRALKMTTNRDVDWRLWRFVADQIRGWITLSEFHDPALNRDVLKVMKERSRKRTRLKSKVVEFVKIWSRKPIQINGL